MAAAEWSKIAAGVWGSNADFENTLKIVLCRGKKEKEKISAYLQMREPSGWGWRQLSHALVQDAGVAHACERISLGTSARTRCSPGPERGSAAIP